jgi:lipoprotein-anchoring transpeptidase ErfK/SrfK
MRRIEANGRNRIIGPKAFRLALAGALMLAAVEAAAQDSARLAPPLASGSAVQPDRRIVASLADRKLALVVGGIVVKVYPVTIGKPSTPSPEGTYRIVTRVPNPTYYHPGLVIPPGRENPVGTRWIGLSRRGFGIHGTDQPRLIGRAASHGCIRMRNRDAEDLFRRVRIGDVVELHATRDAETAAIFGSIEVSEARDAESGAPASAR